MYKPDQFRAPQRQVENCVKRKRLRLQFCHSVVTRNSLPLIKRKTLFILEYFFVSVPTYMGTKKGRIYGKWAHHSWRRNRRLWGTVAPNFSPGSATAWGPLREGWV